MSSRLCTLTGDGGPRFKDGIRQLKPFTHIKSLAKLPVMTGDDVAMLFAWLPAILQSGEGVLSSNRTQVLHSSMQISVSCKTITHS